LQSMHLNRGGAVVFFRNEDKVDDNADEVE
jgi:hypothetical protein